MREQIVNALRLNMIISQTVTGNFNAFHANINLIEC